MYTKGNVRYFGNVVRDIIYQKHHHHRTQVPSVQFHVPSHIQPQHTREKAFLEQPATTTAAATTPKSLEMARRNSIPLLNSALRPTGHRGSRRPSKYYLVKWGVGTVDQNVVSSSIAHAQIPEKRKYVSVQPVPPQIVEKMQAPWVHQPPSCFRHRDHE